MLHVWEGARPLDAFGGAVASAGDQNHDGFDDVIVGAQSDDSAGENAGAAYVYSGRTYRLLRRIDGAHPGDGLGAGVDRIPGGREDDFIIGAATEGGGGGAGVFSGRDGSPIWHRCQ